MFISMKDAVKKYKDGDREIFALDHVNLDIEQGKICVILGPSGSGKSTLLNMLGGLDTMDEGHLTVDGRDISKLNQDKLTDYRREDVGFVFQFYNLIGDLSVAENIEVVADIAKEPLDLDEILTALDIKQYSRRFPKELSGGQQQRVAIGRAMIKNPKLLLCDELTGALDTKSSLNVLNFVEKMNRKYVTTIVIITHNEAIANMAHQIVRLRDGKIFKNENNEHIISAAELQL